MALNLDGTASKATDLVNQLTAYGVKVPKEMSDATAAYTAAMNHQPPGVDVNFETMTVSAKDVGDLIDRGTDAAMRREAMAPVRGEVMTALARRVLRTTTAAAPGFIVALAKPFTDAAQVFTELHTQLPKGYEDSTRLVAAGPAAVAVYQEAAASIVTLDTLRSIRDSLVGTFRIVAPGDAQVEQGTRYCAVRNTGTARRALAALKKAGPLGVWGTLLSTDGVSRLHWLDLEQHAEYVRSLPELENQYEVHESGGFTGHRLVEA